MFETNRIEYKRELNDRLERSIVSFLNHPGGGEIIIGIGDDGAIVGIEDPNSEQLKIVQRIINNVRPQTMGLFDVVLEEIESKNVIRIIISCGQQRPYYIRRKGMTEEGCFLRTGNSSQPMTEQMIEELIAKRQHITLQSTISPRQNLTFKQLSIYYQEKNIEQKENFLNNLDLIQSDGKYNYAAYLLADENGVSLKIATYAGKDKTELLETRDYGNRCLITATNRILDRLDSENRTFARIISKNRIEKERVDSRALREAVINAIVHNDYIKGVPLIELFADKIVVTSCGGLVPDLTEEDFFKCRSMPRNRELMRVFRDVDLAEQIGLGMGRILKAYDKSVFELSPSFTVVTFPFEEAFLVQSDKINEKINGKINLLLTILKNNPTATIPILSEMTGKSQSTISRELKEYQDAGLLRREGSRKAGQWLVN